MQNQSPVIKMYSFRDRLIRFVQWFLAIAVVVLFVSCTSKNDADVKKIVRYDTANGIIGYYVTPDLGQISYGMITRIIFMDSVTWKQIDSSNIRKEIVSDSFYYVPFYPSYEDTITHTQHLDSAKGRRPINAWWLTQKMYVRNGWDSRDSALKYLGQFIKPKK